MALPELSEIVVRRKILGLTQSQLALEAGVSQSLIAKVEAGKTDPAYSRTKPVFDSLERLEQKRGGPTAGTMANRRLVFVRPVESIGHAAELMREKGVSQLPVIEGDSAVVGSISEEILLNKVYGGEKPADLSKRHVSDVMGEPFSTVGEDTPFSAVSALLATSRAVIVTKGGRAIGIITRADVLKIVK